MSESVCTADVLCLQLCELTRSTEEQRGWKRKVLYYAGTGVVSYVHESLACRVDVYEVGADTYAISFSFGIHQPRERHRLFKVFAQSFGKDLFHAHAGVNVPDRAGRYFTHISEGGARYCYEFGTGTLAYVVLRLPHNGDAACMYTTLTQCIETIANHFGV
jgi:hypothetical protein